MHIAFSLSDMLEFNDIYDSDEDSVSSSLSSHIEKDTQMDMCANPVSSINITRTGVSSVSGSLLGASPSVNTLHKLKSPGQGSLDSTPMTLLSRKKTKSQKKMIVEVKPEEVKKTWGCASLKVSDYETELPLPPPLPGSTLISPMPTKISTLPKASLDANKDTLEVKTTNDYMAGVCKIWYAEKGFGFVQSSHDNKDYFCHFSAIEKPGFKCLHDGEKVKFKLCNNLRKPSAKMCTEVLLA